MHLPFSSNQFLQNWKKKSHINWNHPSKNYIFLNSILSAKKFSKSSPFFIFPSPPFLLHNDLINTAKVKKFFFFLIHDEKRTYQIYIPIYTTPNPRQLLLTYWQFNYDKWLYPPKKVFDNTRFAPPAPPSRTTPLIVVHFQ